MGVGAFPGYENAFRRNIPGPKNPLDKCTIVSIYPKDIVETKETIQPGRFHIPPGTLEAPAILVVGSSSWWREIDEKQPLLEIPNSSIQVAESVVKDYINGLLACNMQDKMPGLFYVEGEYTQRSILEKHKTKLADANVKQRNWFMALITLADGLWARTNGNPLTIADDFRLAARELGITNKDWMKDHQLMEQVRCIACGAFRNPTFPICGVCKAVADPELATKLGLQFAK